MEKSPDAFRTISEVADDLDIPQHVLRFWESRFAQIKPMKRGGGRRFYRPDDVDLLRGIRHLLYGQGYTIRGVQRILREQGVRFVQAVWQEGAEQPISSGVAGQGTSIEANDEANDEADDQDEGIGDDPVIRTQAPEREIGQHGLSADGERREPRFAAARDDTPPRAALSPRELSPRERQALQGALAELTECRRLLDVALNESG